MLRSRILDALGSVVDSIEHVGSTSVPGLAAKPTIDMDVVVLSAADLPLTIERLAALGYQHLGNLGIEGREAFESPSGRLAHHLYVCIRGSVALTNHLTVRDYLRQNSDAAAKYGLLKRRLAKQYPTDATQYVEGKTDFLLGVLREAGLPADALREIGDANRRKP